MASLASDRKTLWNMHAPHVNACCWHRRCFCQIELVKRSCWSFPPPEIASLPPFSLWPKTDLKTDDGVDAETFFTRFLSFGIKSTSPLRLLKIYQRSCT